MQYLLDTDWITGYLRASQAFVKAIDDRRAAGIAMSVVTLAELFSGVRSCAWNVSISLSLVRRVSRAWVEPVESVREPSSNP